MVYLAQPLGDEENLSLWLIFQDPSKRVQSLEFKGVRKGKDSKKMKR
jgi:hypothetical protein